MIKIKQWLERNMLTINCSKINYIAFFLHVRDEPYQTMKVHDVKCNKQSCNCQTVESDNKLKLKAHIRNLTKRERKTKYTIKKYF